MRESTFSAKEGLLILPRLQVQNANAIGSPLTHGFPSITAFVGFMWALNRKFIDENIDLNLNGVGVICHDHQEQVSQDNYRKRFSLARHPLRKTGELAPIIEEGHIHLDVSLVFDANWVSGPSEVSLFLQGEEVKRANLECEIAQIISDMRVAGGAIISDNPTATLLSIPENRDARAEQFINLSRQFLPGFSLVSRHDLLKIRWDEMKVEQPSVSLLDAWLDLSRFNYRAKSVKEGEAPPADGSVEWVRDRVKDSGWIVPISIGYAALSPLHAAGTVRSSRDEITPFRFVEALHSIGEWVSPHRLADVDQLLWYPKVEPEKGLYRIVNQYARSGIL